MVRSISLLAAYSSAASTDSTSATTAPVDALPASGEDADVLKSELPLTYADTLRYIASSIDVVIQTGRAGGDRGVLEFYIPDAGDNGDTNHV